MRDYGNCLHFRSVFPCSRSRISPQNPPVFRNLAPHAVSPVTARGGNADRTAARTVSRRRGCRRRGGKGWKRNDATPARAAAFHHEVRDYGEWEPRNAGLRGSMRHDGEGAIVAGDGAATMRRDAKRGRRRDSLVRARLRKMPRSFPRSCHRFLCLSASPSLGASRAFCEFLRDVLGFLAAPECPPADGARVPRGKVLLRVRGD